MVLKELINGDTGKVLELAIEIDLEIHLVFWLGSVQQSL